MESRLEFLAEAVYWRLGQWLLLCFFFCRDGRAYKGRCVGSVDAEEGDWRLQRLGWGGGGSSVGTGTGTSGGGDRAGGEHGGGYVYGGESADVRGLRVGDVELGKVGQPKQRIVNAATNQKEPKHVTGAQREESRSSQGGLNFIAFHLEKQLMCLLFLRGIES